MNVFYHQILRSRLYMGEFEWDGEIYSGTHDPLVSRECWERVQEPLDKRAETKTRRMKHDFALSGLVHCGHCGSLMVGELKKGRHVYYHCTGNRGKCPEPYTRQEVLTNEFQGLIQERYPAADPRLARERGGGIGSHRAAARLGTVKRFWADHARLNARIETMYTDKLDGRITGEFFDQHTVPWHREQDAIIERVNHIRSSTPAPVEAAIDTLRLTSESCALFGRQGPSEQCRLLQLLI